MHRWQRPISIPTWLAVVICLLLSTQLMAGIVLTPGVPTALPSGFVGFTDGGACPGTTVEYTALRGRYVIGLPSGGTNAGTTGTAMANLADASYTPAGTNATVAYTPAGTNGTVSFTPAGTVAAPTFTGSALAGHAHESTTSTDVSAQLTLGAPFGAGSSRTFTSGKLVAGTNEAAAHTTDLTQSVGAGTPAGTNSAPAFTGSAGTVSAQTFTGTAATISAQTFTGSATATIRSTVAPGIQLLACRQG